MLQNESQSGSTFREPLPIKSWLPNNTQEKKHTRAHTHTHTYVVHAKMVFQVLYNTIGSFGCMQASESNDSTVQKKYTPMPSHIVIPISALMSGESTCILPNAPPACCMALPCRGFPGKFLHSSMESTPP